MSRDMDISQVPNAVLEIDVFFFAYAMKNKFNANEIKLVVQLKKVRS